MKKIYRRGKKKKSKNSGYQKELKSAKKMSNRICYEDNELMCV